MDLQSKIDSGKKKKWIDFNIILYDRMKVKVI